MRDFAYRIKVNGMIEAKVEGSDRFRCMSMMHDYVIQYSKDCLPISVEARDPASGRWKRIVWQAVP